jgi:hypothetical protein
LPPITVYISDEEYAYLMKKAEEWGKTMTPNKALRVILQKYKREETGSFGS